MSKPQATIQRVTREAGLAGSARAFQRCASGDYFCTIVDIRSCYCAPMIWSLAPNHSQPLNFLKAVAQPRFSRVFG